MLKHSGLFLKFSISVTCQLILGICILQGQPVAQSQAKIWDKHEISFNSQATYENPLYDVREFYATFTSPSGRSFKVNGFWDGGTTWKIRFMPNETGTWQYQTFCSQQEDDGLHNITGRFTCIANENFLDIYQKGAIERSVGNYHLMYSDGTPFFFTACTAWNGTLKSTDEEWDTYLKHRKDHNYNVIQFVTTQWRGGDQNSEGQVAYTGTGKISIHPEFFQHMDRKVDKINEYGLVAAPVLLWALPVGQGRELSPGYSLPDEEAILLAKYTVARYGAHHVIWILGGDGFYLEQYEDRWKYIGREVFRDDPPGIVSQHPRGRSWIGDAYANEHWLDIVGYQSSHSNQEGTVNWVNKGPMAAQWDKLPPRPIINMEPNYEEIRFEITARDVRNASYWSLFATPIAGITYGANGIWPWIREGERILNHGSPDDQPPSTWRESIDFPGSLQIGYLSDFIQQFEWWKLKPATEVLAEQPGDQMYNHFISVVKTDDDTLILAYVPGKSTLKLYNPQKINYTGRWFNPATNQYQPANITRKNGLIEATSPSDEDWVLVLDK
jgi:hypothetical protein